MWFRVELDMDGNVVKCEPVPEEAKPTWRHVVYAQAGVAESASSAVRHVLGFDTDDDAGATEPS